MMQMGCPKCKCVLFTAMPIFVAMPGLRLKVFEDTKYCECLKCGWRYVILSERRMFAGVELKVERLGIDEFMRRLPEVQVKSGMPETKAEPEPEKPLDGGLRRVEVE